MRKNQRRVIPEAYLPNIKKSQRDEKSFIQLDKLTDNLDDTTVYRADTAHSQLKWNKALSAVKGVSKWVNFVSKRRSKNVKKGFSHLIKRPTSATDNYYETLNSTLNGIASECDDSSDDEDKSVSYNTKSSQKLNHPSTLSRSSNKALIIYFSKLARSTNPNESLDLDFIESLLNNGADINMCDKYGQTIFHEVARIWHCDVAKFLVELKGDLTRADKFGRSPLHIAAAVNYPEMVKFLIENGG